LDNGRRKNRGAGANKSINKPISWEERGRGASRCSNFIKDSERGRTNENSAKKGALSWGKKWLCHWHPITERKRGGEGLSSRGQADLNEKKSQHLQGKGGKGSEEAGFEKQRKARCGEKRRRKKEGWKAVKLCGVIEKKGERPMSHPICEGGGC